MVRISKDFDVFFLIYLHASSTRASFFFLGKYYRRKKGKLKKNPSLEKRKKWKIKINATRSATAIQCNCTRTAPCSIQLFEMADDLKLKLNNVMSKSKSFVKGTKLKRKFQIIPVLPNAKHQWTRVQFTVPAPYVNLVSVHSCFHRFSPPVSHLHLKLNLKKKKICVQAFHGGVP